MLPVSWRLRAPGRKELALGASTFRIVVRANGKVTEEVRSLECTFNPIQLGREKISHWVEETPSGKIVYRLRQAPEGDTLISYRRSELGISRVATKTGRISILPVVEAAVA